MEPASKSKLLTVFALIFGLITIGGTLYTGYVFYSKLDRIEKNQTEILEGQNTLEEKLGQQQPSGGIGDALNPLKWAKAAKELNPVNIARENATAALNTATDNLEKLKKNSKLNPNGNQQPAT